MAANIRGGERGGCYRRSLGRRCGARGGQGRDDASRGCTASLQVGIFARGYGVGGRLNRKPVDEWQPTRPAGLERGALSGNFSINLCALLTIALHGGGAVDTRATRAGDKPDSLFARKCLRPLTLAPCGYSNPFVPNEALLGLDLLHVILIARPQRLAFGSCGRWKV